MRVASSRTSFYLVIACLASITVMLCMLHELQPSSKGDSFLPGTGHVKASASDPVLSAPGLNATFGYANRTIFNYTITYQSDSNAPPAHVNVTLVHENFTASHAMQKVNDSASNYTAGVQYQATITLPTIGNYSHYFTASNGSTTARQPLAGTYPGPSIVWLRNYTMSQVPFTWLNSSQATTPIDYIGLLMYNFNLNFSFPMYGTTFNMVQVSYYGFLRFNLLPLNSTNRYPINVSQSDAFSSYAIIGWSDIIWNYYPNGISDLKVLSTAEYFLVEQQISLNQSTNIMYNASMQYVLYRNGTILLNYDYVKLNFAVDETVGVNFGDGVFYSPYNISASLNKKSVRFVYSFLNATRVLNYSCSPESGTHLTEFMFTLLYQNSENFGPFTVLLTLGGTNYTMVPVSTTDKDYVNGRAYSRMIQFLSPGTAYNHSFHVLTLNGWWHSSVRNTPSTADLPLYNYATCKLHYFDNPTLSSPASVTSLFQTIILPFNFTFYGVNFSSIMLSRYGFIRFNTDTSDAQPVPGSTTSSSRVAITFGDNTVNDGGTTVLYQLFSDKAVFSFPSMTYYGSYKIPLGTYKLILYKTGDIVFSFSNLQAILPGGVNMGEGFHFTSINFTQTSVPLTNTSFIFSPPRTNAAQVAGNVSGTLFKTSNSITFQGAYNSSGNTPVVRATLKIEGRSYHGTHYSPIINQMTFFGTIDGYIENTKFRLSRTLGSGIYNATITFVDIYGTRFNTTRFHFSVNDPPDCDADQTSAYGGVGKTLTVRVIYRDPEGFAPANLTIRWDGINMTMEASSNDFSTTVYFTRSIVLTHGIHNYEIFVKDQHRPETVNVTTTARSIDVRYLPVIEIMSFPPASVMVTGDFDVKMRITSPEPGFALADLYVRVNGVEYRGWRLAPGEADTYILSIRLDWGIYEISIGVTDGYNEVMYPAAGSATITVINLPLILGLVIGAGAFVVITLFVTSKRKKAAAAQQARLRQQVLAKKPTRRDIADSVEQKRKERQEEMKQIDAIDVVQPAPAPVKKSAAVKRATSPSASSGPLPAPTKVSKPAPSSGTQQKDKSGYSQNAVETGTPVNRTVLKEYIERKRKEGARELHYIQIKNDLNIISQKKSSKLYRVLQDLVEDEILVRKGSNYIIVG